MKATLTISKTELEKMIKDHLASLGYTVSSVGFTLAEEGYRSGDTYKVFSGVNVVIDLPPKKKAFEIYEAERPE